MKKTNRKSNKKIKSTVAASIPSNPLYFTNNTEEEATITFTMTGTPTSIVLQTSDDGKTWEEEVTKSATFELTLSASGSLYVVASNTKLNIDEVDYWTISCDKSFAASGDIMSLLNGLEDTTTAPAYCFYKLFAGSDTLTKAPILSATTLSSACYSKMFEGCISLEDAPLLPATSLADYCYEGMFSDCTSLTASPLLVAETLLAYCYNKMFAGCTSLATISCLATDISATNCIEDWVTDVADTGIFYKNEDMTEWNIMGNTVTVTARDAGNSTVTASIAGYEDVYEATVLENELGATEIKCNGDAITTDSTADIYYDGTDIIINKPGVYSLSGSENSTGIRDKIETNLYNSFGTIIFNNLTLNVSDAPAVLLSSSGTILIADDTCNTITGGYTDEYDGAIENSNALATLTLTGSGELKIYALNEGIEVQGNLTISMADTGYLYIESGDDALNGSTDNSSIITINSGNIYCIAKGTLNNEGDAIDSNHKIIIRGGNVYAFGLSSDGSLDSDNGTIIDGGTIIASGGMIPTDLELEASSASYYINNVSITKGYLYGIYNSAKVLRYAFYALNAASYVLTSDVFDEEYTIKSIAASKLRNGSWDDYKIVYGISTTATTYKAVTFGYHAISESGSYNNIIIVKYGDPTETSDDYEVTGTNAATFIDDGILTVNRAIITATSQYAIGAFAYTNGVYNISNSQIVTSKANSSAIMVTEGGSLTATNVTASTAGVSSAAIQGGTGGGDITVYGGTYTSTGIGSPAVYSEALITILDATIDSSHAEAVEINGSNSVTLKNCTVSGNNDCLSDDKTVMCNMLLYQATADDSTSAQPQLTIENSTVTSVSGYMFNCTNSSPVITLINSTLILNDNLLLNASALSWGTTGGNGAIVTLNIYNLTLTGIIQCDEYSSVTINLYDNATVDITSLGTTDNIKIISY